MAQTINKKDKLRKVHLPKPGGADPKYYAHISALLLISFGINGIALFLLNRNDVDVWLTNLVGRQKAFISQLFFWGALSATIASSLFMKHDKELNELESLKANPDPTVCRYPDVIDVNLYLHRIITSGCLALFGAAIVLAGLGYFDVSVELTSPKHKLFLIIFSFLIGLYQGDFITVTGSLAKQLFQKVKKGGSKSK